MVDIPYVELLANVDEDEARALKTDHIQIEFDSSVNQICVTVDVDADNHFISFWFPREAFLKAVTEAIAADELGQYADENIKHHIRRKEQCGDI